VDDVRVPPREPLLLYLDQNYLSGIVKGKPRPLARRRASRPAGPDQVQPA
jgi:hypothetical protein